MMHCFPKSNRQILHEGLYAVALAGIMGKWAKIPVDFKKKRIKKFIPISFSKQHLRLPEERNHVLKIESPDPESGKHWLALFQ